MDSYLLFRQTNELSDHSEDKLSVCTRTTRFYQFHRPDTYFHA
jgi:hypothetical protein